MAVWGEDQVVVRVTHVRKRVFVICKGIISLTAMIGLTGCITIGGTQSESQATKQQFEKSSSQTELRLLANDLANPPWPRTPRLSMTDMVLGSGDDIADNYDPAAIYIDNLKKSTKSAAPAYSPIVTVILKDAKQQLNTADKLNRIAREAAASSRLSLQDVSAVETAILALRENRTVFITSLKALAVEGEAIELGEIRILKTAFVNAGRSLGKTADLMSDQLAGDIIPIYSDSVASSENIPNSDILRSDFADLQ